MRLSRKNAANVDFHIISVNVLGVWLKYLTKKINQIGLHKMFKPLRKLGKGGFARCYELISEETKEVFAVKIIQKSSLIKQRSKLKVPLFFIQLMS